MIENGFQYTILYDIIVLQAIGTNSEREITLLQMFSFVSARQWIVGLKTFLRPSVTNHHQKFD